MGLDRKASAEFSFLLALPVMTATTGYAMLKHYQDFTNGDLMALGAGFLTAYIVARLTMRWFIRFLASFTLVAFGVYCLPFGISEERRVGNECVRTCRSQWSQYH